MNELYNANGILKKKDYIHLINFDIISYESLEAFSIYFPKSDGFHDHATRHSPRRSVIMKHLNTQVYGSFSIRNKAAFSWNFLLNTDVTFESHNKVKRC